MQKNNRFSRFIAAAVDYIKMARFELIVFAAALALDLITKSIIDSTMSLGDSVTLIPKFLHFSYIHNYAAAFGSSFGLDKLLGEQGVRILFVVISFLAVGFFGYFMYRNRGKSKMCRLAFALIIGGALGNLVDRMAFGYVRDFIQFEYFGLTIFGSRYFAVFNIADAALCVGVALFAIYYIFIYKEPKKELADAIIMKETDVTDSENPEIDSANSESELDTAAEDTAAQPDFSDVPPPESEEEPTSHDHEDHA